MFEIKNELETILSGLDHAISAIEQSPVYRGEGPEYMDEFSDEAENNREAVHLYKYLNAMYEQLNEEYATLGYLDGVSM